MFRMASGRLLNHLRRAATPPTFVVGAEDPIFPLTAAYDQRTGSAAMFAAAITDGAILVDKNSVTNGDFESDPLDGWTELAGTLERQESVVNAGAAAGRLAQSGDDPGEFYVDLPAIPGELWGAHWALRAATEAAHIRLQNLHTGFYLAEDGNWTSSAVDLDVQNSTSWKAGTLTNPFVFRVEPYSRCLGDEVTLRLSIMVDGIDGSSAYFDDVAFWPLTDFAGIFGQSRLRGGVQPLILDGDEAYEVRLERGDARTRWAYLNECKTYRTWLFRWSGTPLDAVGFGELVLTQTTKIARANAPGGVAPMLDMEMESRFPQERETVPSGALYVAPSGSGDPSRRAVMSFFLTSEGELSRLRDEVFGPSQGGLHPSILIGPTVIGRDICMFGQFEERLPQSFPGGPGLVYCKVELPFQESVFPRYSTLVLP